MEVARRSRGRWQSKDQDAGRVAEDAEGQASPGSPGNSGGPGDQENPARHSSGEADVVAGAVAREALNPGRGGDRYPARTLNHHSTTLKTPVLPDSVFPVMSVGTDGLPVPGQDCPASFHQWFS